MKTLLVLIALCVTSFSVEIAPTNFQLRDLALQVSQECDKNIIIADDVKNMSVDYFVVKDINPDILLETFSVHLGRSFFCDALFVPEYIELQSQLLID